MTPRFLLREVLLGAPVGAIVEACLEEDADLIRRRRPVNRKDYRRSRIAKGRFAKNRQRYKMAFRSWQQSPEAKAFYRRLGRWNMIHAGFATRPKQRKAGLSQESMELGPKALLAFFDLIVEEFAGRDDELGDLGEFAGYLADELREPGLDEGKGALFQWHYYGPHYRDWYQGFVDVTGVEDESVEGQAFDNFSAKYPGFTEAQAPASLLKAALEYVKLKDGPAARAQRAYDALMREVTKVADKHGMDPGDVLDQAIAAGTKENNKRAFRGPGVDY